MINIYEASKNSDSVEGRGHRVVLGYFLQREDAQKAVKGHGVMGVGDGDVDQREAYESFEEFEAMENGNLRAQALAKLSAAERRALGV